MTVRRSLRTRKVKNQTLEDDEPVGNDEKTVVPNKRARRKTCQDSLETPQEAQEPVKKSTKSYQETNDLRNTTAKSVKSKSNKKQTNVKSNNLVVTEKKLKSSKQSNEPILATNLDLGYLEISIDDPNAPDLLEDEDQVNTPSSSSKRDSIQAVKWDRALRASMRRTDLLASLLSLQWQNRRYSSHGGSLELATLLSIVPRNLQRHLTPEQIQDGRTLSNGISMLVTWWKNTVRLRGAKRVNASEEIPTKTLKKPTKKGYSPVRKVYGNVQATGGKVGKEPIQSTLDDYKHLPPAMRRLLNGQSIAEADYVAMFVGILRALGMECRLVHSLQLIPSKPPPPTPTILRVPASKPKPLRLESGYPIWWVELYHPKERRWMPIDPVRALLDSRKSMEPPTGVQARTGHQHAWIVAAGGPEDTLNDVTRRYCSLYHTVTCRQRRLLEDCLNDSMEAVNQGRSAAIPFYDESTELAAFVLAEPMPTTVGAFKMHGKYVLASHLKKYQVFWPPEPAGEFRGEAVYLRENVQPVRSKEAWFTQYGRVIRDGEVPCKTVKLPKRPSKGGGGADAEQATTAFTQPLQPLFGEWQTEPYCPPAAKDGRVPRNEYGNVDLFQPTMLPLGCAYIPYTEAWKAARQLGVDYANACTRFAFHGRMAIPNICGIVVCQEDEEAVLNLHYKLAEEALHAAMEAEEEEARRRERLERQSLRIAERIQTDYADLLTMVADEEKQQQQMISSDAKHKDDDGDGDHRMIQSAFITPKKIDEEEIEDDCLFE